MSYAYATEPPTKGKVVLKTTMGDLEIELWPKEAPKAVRNFVQLCLEGYYDETQFHRLVKGFIVQGGDPTGTGTGGESIYSEPFPDEIHTRLRFSHRGLLAMANTTRNCNNSQFFFTLDKTPELDRKNTIFGKVVGDTIYNLLEIGEAEVGEDERPLYPIKIKSVEVLSNPFDDIEPRTTSLERKADREAEEGRLAAKDANSRKIKGKKNLNLLSFGDEAETEEISMKAIAPNKRKIASIHDLLTEDQRLSKEGLDPVAKSNMPVPAVSSREEARALKKRSIRDEKESESEEDSSDDEMEQSKAPANAKQSSNAPSSKVSAVRSEVAKLQNELRQMESAKRAARATEASTDKSNQKMNPLEEMRNKYKGKARMGKRLKSSGEDRDILKNLAAFKDKILNPDESVAKSQPKEEKVCSLHGLAGCRSCVKHGEDDDADDDDSGWFAHDLHFKKDAANVYEPTVDDYSFFDPRNPQASDEKKRAKESGSRDGGRGFQQRDTRRSLPLEGDGRRVSVGDAHSHMQYQRQSRTQSRSSSEADSHCLHVSTSVSGFVVVVPKKGAMTQVLTATNAVLAAHGFEHHQVVALRTNDGHVFDLTVAVAIATENNQHILALSDHESRAAMRRVVTHSFFESIQDYDHTPTPTPLLMAPKDSTAPIIRDSLMPPATFNHSTVAFNRDDTPDRSSLSVFLSYCWANSAAVSGAERSGSCDPRHVRNYLLSEGFSDVWIDTDKINSGDDLFEQIANGLMASDVMVVCVSDEYAASKNCVRELNFGLNVMKIPFIPLVVGSGFKWQMTKVGLMFGDQTYIDATNEKHIHDRLEDLVTALDRVISSRRSSQESAQDEEQGTITAIEELLTPTEEEKDEPEDVPMDQEITLKNTVLSNPPQVIAKSKFTHSFVDTMNIVNVSIGDKVEVLRWRKNNRNHFVAGGLHWVPVTVLEILPAPMEGSSGRRIRVLFQSRVSYSKTRNGPVIPTIVGEDEEWVEDFLIRKRTELPKVTAKRTYRPRADKVHRRSSKSSTGSFNATSDSGTSVVNDDGDEEDTYMYWPAYIASKLENGKYLVKQGRGMGLISETGNYAAALKPVSARLLRTGHDIKLVRVRQALNAGKLLVLPRGSIVRPESLPDSIPMDKLKWYGFDSEAAEGIAAVAVQRLDVPDSEAVSPRSSTPTPSGNGSNSKKMPKSKWDSSKHKNQYHGEAWDALSSKERLVTVSRDIWTDACTYSTRADPFEKAVIWVSYNFQTATEHCSVDPAYLMKMLASRNITVLDCAAEVGNVELLNQDQVRVRLMKGIVKANIFLALLTPEYCQSEIHRKEIEYARHLNIPVTYAILKPLSATSSNNSKEGSSFLNFLSAENMIDLTVKQLLLARLDTLVYKMALIGREADIKLRAARQRDEDPADLPWKRNALKLNSGDGAEALDCVLMDVDCVEFDATENQGTDVPSVVQTAISPQLRIKTDADIRTVSVCGLSWTHHISLLSQGDAPKDKFRWACQHMISPSPALSFLMTWQYDGMVDWDSSSVGRISFKPTKLLRYCCLPADTGVDGWKVGDLVEVRMYWHSGDLGDSYLWWPGKIVQSISQSEYIVLLQHSETLPSTTLPYIKATNAQLRAGVDPRATVWHHPSHFYIDERETPDGSMQNIPAYRYGGELMDRYLRSIKSREAMARLNHRVPRKDLPDINEMRVLEYSKAGVKLISCKPLPELAKMVARLDSDPNPTLWTNGVVIHDEGTVVEFTEWTVRCAVSAYSFFEKSLPERGLYVEVEIVDMDWCYDAGHSHVSIGIVPTNYSPFSAVGWNALSLGYSSMHGRKLTPSDTLDFGLQGRPYGPGDVVGVGVTIKGEVFFTLNGEFQFRTTLDGNFFRHHLGISSDGPAVLKVVAERERFKIPGDVLDRLFHLPLYTSSRVMIE
ncbi:hypothetical protein HDU81_003332 [Chytriomyces hyalinus]|nr:hypothetical protein HDU81_003332 [Chytriomyces hyalinus]